MPGVMLWGGESLESLEEIRPWLEAGVYDAMQIDASRQGLSEDLGIAGAAREHGIRIVPHNWQSSIGTAANLHLTAAAATGHICEFFMYPNGFRCELLKDPPRPVEGWVTLPDRPGLGIEVVEDIEKRFPYEPGPNTLPNPRFPHALDRARAREGAVRKRYARAR